MARIETRGKHRFHVEIDGLVVAHFQAVTGINWENETLPFQEGGKNDAMHKLPGQSQYGQITLKRGYTGDSAFFGWMKQVRDIGDAKFSPRKTVDVLVLTEDGREDGRYTLHRAWPSKWTMEDFDTSSSALAVETMELAHEGLVWAKGRGGSSGSMPSSGLGSRLSSANQSALSRAQSALASAPNVGSGAAGLLDQARGALAAGQGILAQAQSAASQAQGLRSQLESAWQQAQNAVPATPTPPDPLATARDAMAAAQAAVPPPPTPPAPPGPESAGPGAGSAAAKANKAKDAVARAKNAPPAMKEKAEQAARGFVRSGKKEAAEAGNAKWSDGVDEVQPATGFDESPVSATPRVGPPF